MGAVGRRQGPAEPGRGVLEQSRARPDAMWRSCEPGHLTASALVLSADRSATAMRAMPRWWQRRYGRRPRSPASPTWNSTRCRCGWTCTRSPCSLGRPTRHLDVQFRALAPAGDLARISAESDDLAWHPVNALPDAADRSVRSRPRSAAQTLDVDGRLEVRDPLGLEASAPLREDLFPGVVDAEVVAEVDTVGVG